MEAAARAGAPVKRLCSSDAAAAALAAAAGHLAGRLQDASASTQLLVCYQLCSDYKGTRVLCSHDQCMVACGLADLFICHCCRYALREHRVPSSLLLLSA